MDASRRRFLTHSGHALGAAWFAVNWPKIAAAAAHAHEASLAAPERRFAILNSAQARDLDAISAQIIPTDEVAGAREAGAVHFMDAALGGFHTVHRDEFLAGHAEFAKAFAARSTGLAFADATLDSQLAFLQAVEATPFFQSVRFLTVLGFLASPKYGGNRDGIGWQVIGFEDKHVFSPPFGYYDRDYSGFVPYPKKDGA